MKRRSISLSLLSGLLLVLGFPVYNLSAFAWIALLPLFFAIEGESRKHSLKYGFITGFVFFLGLIYWIINTMMDYGGIPGPISILLLITLSAYLGFYFSVFSYSLSLLTGNLKAYKWIFAPFLWITLEYTRGHLFTGFPWGLIGYSQYTTLPMIQIADITGVYGVSFLIVLVNGTIYSLLKYFRILKNKHLPPVNKKPVLILAALTVSLTSLTFAYGISALKQFGSAEGKEIKISLIQGNIDQSLKWDRAYRDKTLDIYERLTLDALKDNPDLVIWPETAAPFFFQQPGIYRDRLTTLTRTMKTPLLFGSPAYERRGEEKFDSYNRAYLLNPSGTVSGHYEKTHLVPFGEYVPLKSLLTFVDKLVEGVGDFSAGVVHKVFKIEKASFSTLICYEIIFPDLVRKFIDNGADFLVHITNDAWFGKSSAPYQHLSMVTLRAVENRVPVARAANTGITAVISATGEIKKESRIFKEEQMTGVVRLVKTEKTLYTVFGDFFAQLCCIITFITLVFTTISRKKNERKHKKSSVRFKRADRTYPG